MRITITARHCEIPDELRARARERLERLARIAPRPHDGRVVFVADHGRPTVEVRLHTARGWCTWGRRAGRITAPRWTSRWPRCGASSTRTPPAAWRRDPPRPGARAPVTKPKVRDLLERKGDLLQLEALTGDVGLDHEIPSPEASSPGLVLAGYTKRFAAHRIHILGETEVTYLASLDAAARRRALETLLQFELPCVVISKGQEPPAELVELARARGVAVIRTRLKTAEFYRRLKPFLDDVFAPPPRCTRRSPTCSEWDCCSSAARGSGRASACSISWSVAIGWSRTTSFTSPAGATTC